MDVHSDLDCTKVRGKTDLKPTNDQVQSDTKQLVYLWLELRPNNLVLASRHRCSGTSSALGDSVIEIELYQTECSGKEMRQKVDTGRSKTVVLNFLKRVN